MERSLLYWNRWVSLVVATDPAHDKGGYVYATETRCKGQVIAVLPFRIVAGENAERTIEYLLKSEITPAWGPHHELSAITGGWEGGNFSEDAVRELAEETGYHVDVDDLIPLGNCYAGKASDTNYSLYSVNLTYVQPGPVTGDGSVMESLSRPIWVTEEQLLTVRDAQVSVMLLRLRDHWHRGWGSPL